jgi:hypothetical protein
MRCTRPPGTLGDEREDMRLRGLACRDMVHGSVDAPATPPALGDPASRELLWVGLEISARVSGAAGAVSTLKEMSLSACAAGADGDTTDLQW